MQSRDEPEAFKLMQMEIEFLRKRLRGMAMISRGIVPNLVLSRAGGGQDAFRGEPIPGR